LRGLDATKPTADTSSFDAFFDLRNNEFRAGNDRSKKPDGSPVDPEGDAEYLHFIPGIGFFFKLANFIVTAIFSLYQRTVQNCAARAVIAHGALRAGNA
jgi:hypothetical protein